VIAFIVKLVVKQSPSAGLLDVEPDVTVSNMSASTQSILGTLHHYLPLILSSSKRGASNVLALAHGGRSAVARKATCASSNSMKL
jgi:hypothetical protein